MRASDSDRDRVASMLREHHAEGRLTADEFQERLDATFAAKTLGDLDKLMADLPGIDLYHLPEATIRHGQQPRLPDPAMHGRLSPAWRGAWGSWASCTLLLFTIWLITSIGSNHVNGLWFLWIAGPWGAILFSRWMFGGHPGGGPPRPVQGPPGGPVPQLQADRDAGAGDHLPGEGPSHHEEHMRRRDEHLRRREDYLRRREQRMRDRRNY
ncbi:MAG TPA: DUF1707 domain-containing protein [Streptosporangiaceae bacterium]|jgi:hypothetical protein